ncbi:hypothetical protein [Sulfitobacter sp.]|uniref:hypothetical protein n=1 Tax=Sulfitobacter sp. TaxID=1903071 RepID=UPI003569B917
MLWLAGVTGDHLTTTMTATHQCSAMLASGHRQAGAMRDKTNVNHSARLKAEGPVDE